jgi:hypothetical protein
MRRGLGILLLVLAALALPATAGSRAAPTTVRITLTAKGGGRYLDVTRWLDDSTRECYARKTADETLSVSWQVEANMVITDDGVIVTGAPVRRTVQGSVNGTAVKDFCDQPQEGLAEVGADWPAAEACNGPMQVHARPFVRAAKRGANTVLTLQGPAYGSPPKPCELFVRNDQLTATATLTPTTLARLQGGHRVTAPVGTFHPTPQKTYEPTRTCSQFPHIYDGIVYLYDCEDTLIWNGTLTLTPSR